jgi:hypothetical protein
MIDDEILMSSDDGLINFDTEYQSPGRQETQPGRNNRYAPHDSIMSFVSAKGSVGRSTMHGGSKRGAMTESRLKNT